LKLDILEIKPHFRYRLMRTTLWYFKWGWNFSN